LPVTMTLSFSEIRAGARSLSSEEILSGYNTDVTKGILWMPLSTM